MCFGSSDLSPKRSSTTREETVRICFLQADTSDNEFLSAANIGHHPLLMKEREMLSSTHVNSALTRPMNDLFQDKMRVAGKTDEMWQEWGRELVRLRESGKMRPDKWIEKDRLLYYKNRLYIPQDKALQSDIA